MFFYVAHAGFLFHLQLASHKLAELLQISNDNRNSNPLRLYPVFLKESINNQERLYILSFSTIKIVYIKVFSDQFLAYFHIMFMFYDVCICIWTVVVWIILCFWNGHVARNLEKQHVYKVQ